MRFTYEMLSNKGVGFHYARESVKQKEALHCIYACTWMNYLCNGAK